MQVRVPTPSSLVIDRIAGGVLVVGLALNLVRSSPLPTVLNAIMLVAVAVLTQLSISRQRKGEADFALVSPPERRAFLVTDTVLLLVFVTCLGVVLYLTLSSQSPSTKVWFGLPTLAVGAVAGYLRGPLLMEHAGKVFPSANPY